MGIKTIHPEELTIPVMHKSLLSAIGPRPICFASTVNKDGIRNLSPFSFFNVFSTRPPILIFSPARSGRTGQSKNTYDNVLEVPEVVINVVTYDMAHQMSLASSPYHHEVDEFVKSHFTPIESEKVKPARVKESPVQIECKVNEVKSFGDHPGAGQLIICEVVAMHMDEDFLNEDGYIDQTKIDLIARMGGNWYARAHGDALFEIPKPLTTIGIGIDALPDTIKHSPELTGNELGLLGSLEELPTEEEIEAFRATLGTDPDHMLAKKYLKEHKAKEAAMVLMGLK